MFNFLSYTCKWYNLCQLQGFTTYYLHGDTEVHHTSYFWRILETSFPAIVKDSVKGLRMSKDNKGVVYDIPSNLCSVIQVK